MSSDKYIYYMETCFITFGAAPIHPERARCRGKSDYYGAVDRITKQAKHTGLFTKIKGWTDGDLRNDDAFWSQHKDFITGRGNAYGFGYFIWKPYIIKQTLSTLSSGDILLYLDAGCEIHPAKTSMLESFFKQVPESLIIGSEAKMEYMRSPVDLMKKLDVYDPRFYKTRQRQAGTNMFYVCDRVINLVSEWYDLCCDYETLVGASDTFTYSNIDGFKGNRHDQSIFSLLTKKHGFDSWSRGLNIGTAVEIIWNRTGVSKLNI